MFKHPVPVVRAILKNSAGEVLFLQRSDSEYGNGQWCLPGGKIDYQQTVVEACLREAKEETNLDISTLQFLFYQDNFPIAEGKMHCISFYFKANYSGTLKLNHESSQAKWIKQEDFVKYDIIFQNREAVVKYLK